MSVPLVPPTLQRDRGLHDTEELVKHEETPDEDDGGDDLGNSHSSWNPGASPAILTPATLPLDGVTTTESTSDNSSSAVVNIGQINPAFDAKDKHPSTPVQYVANGETRTTQESRVVTREDGSRVVISRPSDVTDEDERELKEKDLRFLTIFSILAVVLFFPSGIPAVIYTNKTKREFRIGKQKNDMTKAKKLSKRAEKLIILSLICGLLTLALVFAIVERAVWGHRTDYYHQHALAHPIG